MSDYTEAELNEIDAMVAEKVMGWKYHRCHKKNPQGETVYHFRNDAPPEWWKQPTECARPLGGPNIRISNFGLLAYTRDIRAAWEVVEKMHTAGWYWCVEGLASPQIRCFFYKVEGINDYYDRIASTASLAISLAALSAVGHPFRSKR